MRLRELIAVCSQGDRIALVEEVDCIARRRNMMSVRRSCLIITSRKTVINKHEDKEKGESFLCNSPQVSINLECI